MDKPKTKQGIDCKRAGKIKTSERCSRSSAIPFPSLPAAALKLKPHLNAGCWECQVIDSYSLCIQHPSCQFSKPLKLSIAIPASCSLLTQPQEDIRSKGRGERGWEKGATYPADILLRCAMGRCKCKENCGAGERKREKLHGVSWVKSMPEFHHSNCRERNMA